MDPHIRVRVTPRKYWSRQSIGLMGCVLFLVVTGVQVLPTSKIPDESCDSAQECFEEASSFQLQNPDQLSRQVEQFRQVQKTYPGTVWGRRAGVRIGRILLHSEPAAAVQFFQTALRDFPILEDYLRFWLGEAWVGVNDFLQAAIQFQLVLETESPTTLKEDATFGAGKAWYQAEDCERALPFLHQAVSLASDSSSAAWALLKVADCALQVEKPGEAVGALQEIWWRYPETPEAAVATDRLSGGANTGASWVPGAESRWKRARSYYRVAYFHEAISDLREALAGNLKGASRTKATFKLGMAHVRLKQYDQARQVFQQLAQTPSSYRGRATVWLARVYLRQDAGKELLSLAQSRLSALSSSQKARVIWMAGLWLEDQGRMGEALAKYQEAARMTGHSDSRLDALWGEGWLRYQTQAFEQAAKTFLKMEKEAKDRNDLTKAWYWRARAMDQLGRHDEASQVYVRLVDTYPFTYYGLLARLRNRSTPDPLTSLSEGPQVSSVMAPKPVRLQENVHFRKAMMLRTMGLPQESKRELLAIPKHQAKDPVALQEISVLLNEVGEYEEAIVLAKRYFQDDIEQGQLDRHSSLWGVAYPTGYLSTIQQDAEDHVDPYLIAGIIREESLFNPKALSPVGAMGLMQLMPKTANRLAKVVGLPPVNRKDLFNGELNIRLGTKYVGELLRAFKGNVVYTVAAYNAGPDAVRRWDSLYKGKDPDEFVELIAYRETRKYVKRVLTSYRVYHQLDATRCSSHSLDSVC